MFGTILKYTAAAFAGAVIFATCMHVADEEAVKNISAAIDAHIALRRAEGMDDASVKESIANYIRANRGMWDKTYTMAETGRRVEELYARHV